MAHTSGTATGTGPGDTGHYKILELLRTFVTGTLGWVEMRYDGTTIGKIASITCVGTLATVTTNETHGQVSGASITISGCTDATYNGTYSINVLNTTQFTYTMAGTPSISPAAGTPVGTGTLVDREVIWKAPGLSSTEQIYIGIKTYQNVSLGYYNFRINAFTGYLASNSWNTQPGRVSYNITIPLWAGAIDYDFCGDGAHLFVYCNVSGNDHSFYIGKPLPYCTPDQWPYPLIVAGMVPSDTATLYSDNSQVAWWKGNRNNLAMKFVDGTWRTPQVLTSQMSNTIRNTKANSTATEVAMPGYWGLHSLILSENITGYVNNYCELYGVYFISGFSNTSGNTITIGGDTYKVIGDITKTGFKDYIAFKLG